MKYFLLSLEIEFSGWTTGLITREKKPRNIPRREIRWGIYLNVGEAVSCGGVLGLQQPGRVHKAKRADVAGAVGVVTNSTYVFCGLLYNAIVSNGWVNGELERMWKEVVLFRHYSGIFLGRLMENTYNFRHDSRASKWASPYYESRALTATPYR
jgi:hypothetical protein